MRNAMVTSVLVCTIASSTLLSGCTTSNNSYYDSVAGGAGQAGGANGHAGSNANGGQGAGANGGASAAGVGGTTLGNGGGSADGGGTTIGGGTSGGGSAGSGSVGPIDHDRATLYAVYPQLYSQAGNFAAVTSDLPRIHDLGFSVLYLMPVTPLGKAVGSHPNVNSPYCVLDYRAINPAFGTAADLTALVKTAHGLGMQVILDEVLNHTSWDNALITQHPEFYVHTDNDTANPNTIQAPDAFPDVAQLDYKTTSNGLAAYMEDMLTYWVETFDVDGFRFDTADNPYGDSRMITLDFWKELRVKLLAAKPGLFMLGEAEDPDLIGTVFDADYGWKLDGIYDSGLQQVASGGDAMSTMKQALLNQTTGFPGATRHMTLLQTWDLDEDLKIYGGVPNTLAAATFNFTFSGLPMLFNGEEVGNDNSSKNTHTVINWKSANAASFTSFYRSLLALRNANTALQQGDFAWLDNSAASKVVSFSRSDSAAQFVVVINFSNSPITGTLTSPPSAASWRDVSPIGSPGGTSHTALPNFSLEAYDFAVFSSK
jgi:glycosidase